MRKTYRQRVIERSPTAKLERSLLDTSYVYSIRIGGDSISGGRSFGEADNPRGAWRAALDCLPEIKR